MQSNCEAVDHYAANNPVRYVDLDGRADTYKLIIGISVNKNGKDFFGQHSFIMLLNETNPINSIMLDASGHFLEKYHFRDVFEGKGILPLNLSLNLYLNYWKGCKEFLYTFEMELKEKDARKIYDLILAEDSKRSFLKCTEKASRVIRNSGLFRGITQTSKPKDFLDQMFVIYKNYKSLIMSKYDLETGKEVSDNANR